MCDKKAATKQLSHVTTGNRIHVYRFKKNNDNAFLQDLTNSEIRRVAETKDPNVALAEFYESFRGTLNMLFPREGPGG